MTTRKVVVVGAGGHAVSLTETIIAAGFEIVAFTSSHSTRDELFGIPVYAKAPTSTLVSDAALAIAVGDNSTRARLWEDLTREFHVDRFPTFVHPSASVSRYADLGPGTAVLQGAIVGSSARLKIGCIVNSGSIIEHECTLGDFASMGPGSAIGGRACLGDRVALGMGAVVKHGLDVGRDTVIGAGSYVHTDIPEKVVAFGSPARIVRMREPGDTYL